MHGRRRAAWLRSALVCGGISAGFVVASTARAEEKPAQAVVAAPTSAPIEGSARELSEQAVKLYEEARYAEALERLERAYVLEPNPGVLYNLGAVHAALHHCERARNAYSRYIDQTRSESGRIDAARQIERLNACVEAPVAASASAPPASGLAPEPPPPAALPPAALPAASAASPEATTPAPVPSTPSRDVPPPAATDSGSNGMRVAGWLALGAGGVLGLASLGCTYASWRADDADRRAAPGQSGDAAALEQDAGQRYNALAWGLAGGAAALVGSGVLLLWLGPDDDTSVQVAAPVGEGLGLSLAQRF